VLSIYKDTHTTQSHQLHGCHYRHNNSYDRRDEEHVRQERTWTLGDERVGERDRGMQSQGRPNRERLSFEEQEIQVCLSHPPSLLPDPSPPLLMLVR